VTNRQPEDHTDHLYNLDKHDADHDIDCLGQVGDWSCMFVVLLRLEQLLEQTVFAGVSLDYCNSHTGGTPIT